MKSKIVELLNLFCRLATLIFIFSSIYIYYFDGNSPCLCVDYVFGVLILSLITSILRLPILGDETACKYFALAYRIFYYLVVNIAVFITGKNLHWFSLEIKLSVVFFELIIIIISFSMEAIYYIGERMSANKMNEKLRYLQNQNQNQNEDEKK